MKKWMGMLFVALLALGLAAPAMAQELNNSEVPGSVIVFAKFIKGTTVAGGEVVPKSEFNISVTCPLGAVCAEGQSVKLLARWVCPGDQNPQKKFICKEVDFELTTTVKSTLTFGAVATSSLFGATGSNARRSVPAPPCDRGFLIAWVVSPADGDAPRAIKFDGLIGHAVLRNYGNDASAYNAYPIQAVSTLANNASTDVDNDLRLDFNGTTEYKLVTGQVRATVQLDRDATRNTNNQLTRFERQSAITLLTLDVISNRPNFPTFVDLHWFNEQELLLSTSLEFICWIQVEITDIDDNLDEFFGRKALLESTEAEKVAIFGVDDIAGPVTLIGIVETIEGAENADFDNPRAIKNSYSYNMFNDGRGVTTSFEPN